MGEWSDRELCLPLNVHSRSVVTPAAGTGGNGQDSGSPLSRKLIEDFAAGSRVWQSIADGRESIVVQPAGFVDLPPGEESPAAAETVLVHRDLLENFVALCPEGSYFPRRRGLMVSVHLNKLGLFPALVAVRQLPGCRRGASRFPPVEKPDVHLRLLLSLPRCLY